MNRTRVIIAMSLVLSACSSETLFWKSAEAIRKERWAALRAQGHFVCDPDEPPVVEHLQRLSNLEYQRSISTVLSEMLSTANYASVMSEILNQNLFELLPGDAAERFGEHDNRISSRIGPYFDIASAISTIVTSTTARLRDFAGNCITQVPVAPSCRDAYLNNLLSLVYRRPPTSPERDRFVLTFDESIDATEAVQRSFLQSLNTPNFLYHLYFFDSVTGGAIKQLNDYGVAAKLSFFFLKSTPTRSLLDAAARGDLSKAANYAQIVTNLAETVVAAQTVERFFAEWLEFDNVAPPNMTDPRVLTLVNENFQNPSSFDAISFAAAATAEAEEFFSFYWQSGSNYRGAMMSNLSFARDADLAEIMESSVLNVDPIANPELIPRSSRRGVFRVAITLNENGINNPALSGVKIKRKLLCQEIADPESANLPPSALAPPPLSATASTNARFDQKLQASPICMNCHSGFQPLGRPLSGINPLGRETNMELIMDGNGAPVSYVSAETNARVEVDQGLLEEVAGIEEFVLALSRSNRANRCYVRSALSFHQSRMETLAGDGCQLKAMEDALNAPGGSMKSMLISGALHENFKLLRTSN